MARTMNDGGPLGLTLVCNCGSYIVSFVAHNKNVLLLYGSQLPNTEFLSSSSIVDNILYSKLKKLGLSEILLNETCFR